MTTLVHSTTRDEDTEYIIWQSPLHESDERRRVTAELLERRYRGGAHIAQTPRSSNIHFHHHQGAIRATFTVAGGTDTARNLRCDSVRGSRRERKRFTGRKKESINLICSREVDFNGIVDDGLEVQCLTYNAIKVLPVLAGIDCVLLSVVYLSQSKQVKISVRAVAAAYDECREHDHTKDAFGNKFSLSLHKRNKQYRAYHMCKTLERETVSTAEKSSDDVTEKLILSPVPAGREEELQQDVKGCSLIFPHQWRMLSRRDRNCTATRAWTTFFQGSCKDAKCRSYVSWRIELSVTTYEQSFTAALECVNPLLTLCHPCMLYNWIQEPFHKAVNPISYNQEERPLTTEMHFLVRLPRVLGVRLSAEETLIGRSKMNQPQHFEAEPEYSNEEMSERLERENAVRQRFAGRAGNTEWCTCGNCRVMPDNIQSICCNDSEEVKIAKGGAQCVTIHDAFKTLILNEQSLTLSRHKMLSFEKDYLKAKKLKNLDAADTWRYVAYRDFILWVNCKKNLGRNIRVPIPSCAVWAVRDKWPEPGGLYTGFKLTFDPEFENILL
ncbi:hypothetical protein B566_EDAN008067 [Ephemera danica]|nr:hypothetical protein B566_EDAN008067 [Ephemera danica]